MVYEPDNITPRRQAVCATGLAKLDPADYTVAWIAPLEIEAQAARCLLDEQHHGRFPVGRGDDYVFQAGSMSGHNVIIATLSAGQEYGTGSAAALVSQVKRFFPNLWFGLLVGVAAGLPDLSKVPARDIRLGDVLVALPEGENAGLIAYDLGKEMEDGFRPLRLGHALAMTEPIVRSAIGRIKLETPNDIKMFLPHYRTMSNQKHSNGTFSDPGQDRDILYVAHHNGSEAVAQRNRRSDTERTRVWYGSIGSGEKLLRNSHKRNELRDRYGIIGLEMEAAGTMNRFPVGVIRGVCDYGDEHKNKDWQPYAAAMAASYAKAVLDQIPPSDRIQHSTAGKHKQAETAPIDKPIRQPCYHIQLAKNSRFTGRTSIIDTLEDNFFIAEQSRKMALVGLGGAGKTQIALHFAYQVKEKRPDCSIFWVPVLSQESVEQAYAAIAKKLGLQKMNGDDKITELVCQYLSSDEAGKWLLVVDNCDDQDLVFGSPEKPGIEEYLPESENGLTLLTTRSRHVAVEFAQSDVIDVEQMSQEEATCLLEESLNHSRRQLLQDKALISELLDRLTFLPLAITQAAAYLNQTMAPLRSYLALLKGGESNFAEVLGREFRDKTRYRQLQNAVGTTWQVSFDQIEQSNHLAIDLLSFMSCIEPKAIPCSILPKGNPEELDWAIGTLCGYSFLVRRGDSDIFDMHSLVHGAVRGWVEKHGRREQVLNDAIRHLAQIIPPNNLANRDLWREQLPHAMRLLYQQDEHRIEDVYDLFAKVGDCFFADRRFKEAVRCYEEVCQWTQKAFSENDPIRLRTEHWLAVAFINDRRTIDGRDMLEHVVAVKKEILAEKDHNRLLSEHELARAYLDNYQVTDAIGLLEHIVAVQNEILPEKAHNQLVSKHELARAYLNNHQITDAIEILEHVVAVQKETLAEGDQYRLVSEHELACAYLNNHQITDAIEILEHVVAVQKTILTEKDQNLLTSQHELARAYLDNYQITDAIGLLEHIVAVRKETLAQEDYYRLISEDVLARAYLIGGKVHMAITLLEHSVAVRSEILPEDHRERVFSVDLLTKAYRELSVSQSAPDT